MDFAGLEEGANRYDLLLLVKKLGKFAGFTPRMIHLLDYYLAFTRDQDWEEGSRPIVYQSLSRTALDLGVTERQIQKLEKALADLGAVTWHDSGNHKRYGQRDPKTGRILYAFGIELTPLAAMRAELEDKLHQKQMRDAAWMETKRQISWYRSQVRSLLCEWAEEGGETVVEYVRKYESIAVPIRTHLDLPAMRLLLDRHKSLHSEVLSTMGAKTAQNKQVTQCASVPKETLKSSPRDEQTFAHYKSTTQQSFVKTNTGNPAGECFQKSVVETPVLKDPFHTSGIDHIKLSHAIGAASSRFLAHLPSEPGWRDVHEAAYRIRQDLMISQESWGVACDILGRTGAALCVLITDRSSQRDENHVRQPAAYFRGMINRARGGELHLHKSVFGMLNQRGTMATRGSVDCGDRRPIDQ